MKKFKVLIYIFFLIAISYLLHTLNVYADTNVYEIKAKIVNYEKNNNTIIAIGDAEAKNKENKKIFADKITYNKNLDLIVTEGNSSFFDDNNLSIFADSFEYNANLRTILATKNVIIRLNDETFYFDDFKYYESNESGSGNKFKGKLKDGSTVLAERAELSKQSGIKTLTKAKYTPCKETNDKNNEFCPSWSATSSSAVHDKEARTITYKNAFLNLKNIPVMYTPYLSVPDPTVKRQSGFLSPSFQKLSDIAVTMKLPYFFAISDDKDLTITPVFYNKENNVYLANYRQKFKTSYLEIDTSFTKGYDNIDVTGRTPGARSHLFANFSGDFKNILFKDTEVKLKLQNTNNSTYLMVNQINPSNLIKFDIRNLENSLELFTYEAQKSLNFKIATFQNLDTNKYEYILPQINYSTFKEIYNNQISISSSLLVKNFSTNQTQESFTNTINTTSNQYVFKNYGIGSIFKTNITNINLNNDNVSGQKQNLFSDNYFTMALDNTYPLFKKDKNSNTYYDLTPRFFLKYTTGTMANLQSSGKVLNYSDIYSMNRMNDPTNPETGLSVGAGFDWSLNKRDINNETIYKSNFSLGQVFRKKNMNMPSTSSLQNSSSDIVGIYEFNYLGEKTTFENINKIKNIPDFKRNFMGLKYEFNLDNNLSGINKNLFTLSSIYNSNFFSTSLEVKDNYIGSTSSIIMNYKKILFDQYFFDIERKKNFKDNYTEYTNIKFLREEDCLSFGFGFNQQGYANNDLKPSRNLFFTITFKPFGEATNADLSSLLK